MKKLILFLFLTTFLNLYSENIIPEMYVSISADKELYKSIDNGTLTIVFKIPDGFYQSLQKEFFYVKAEVLSNASGIIFDDTVFPETIVKNNIQIYKNEVNLVVPFHISNPVNKMTDVKLDIGYQLCNEAGTCFLPVKISKSITLNTILSSGNIDFLYLLLIILFAFAGGFILNFMPCVLPVLSLKALNILNHSDNDKRKILTHSLYYTAGILSSFLILSFFVIFLKGAGESVGWGFQFQNPLYLVILSLVIFIFALSLFDVFIILPPDINKINKAAGSNGYSGSFFTGIFAVLLATPCTAPFLGTALGFAFSAKWYYIIFIFFLIGLGLALPFLLIGFFPALIKKIPKPGQWMVIFKEIMGFLLIISVLWFLNILFYQKGGEYLIKVLVIIFIGSVLSWIYGKLSVKFMGYKSLFLIAGVIIILSLSINFLLKESFNKLKTSQSSLTDELSFSEENLNKYLSDGKSVFIDFTAEWCLTCKTNELLVLNTKEVKDFFIKNNVVVLKADFTNQDETIFKWITKFGKAGVPVYVIYKNGTTIPYILPEILTKEMIFNTFH